MGCLAAPLPLLGVTLALGLPLPPDRLDRVCEVRTNCAPAAARAAALAPAPGGAAAAGRPGGGAWCWGSLACTVLQLLLLSTGPASCSAPLPSPPPPVSGRATAAAASAACARPPQLGAGLAFGARGVPRACGDPNKCAGDMRARMSLRVVLNEAVREVEMGARPPAMPRDPCCCGGSGGEGCVLRPLSARKVPDAGEPCAAGVAASLAAQGDGVEGGCPPAVGE